LKPLLRQRTLHPGIRRADNVRSVSITSHELLAHDRSIDYRGRRGVVNRNQIAVRVRPICEVAGSFLDRRDRDHRPGRIARGTVSLPNGEKEWLALGGLDHWNLHRATNRPAKLVFDIRWPNTARSILGCIQHSVAEVIESDTVKLVRARFRLENDARSCAVPIFRRVISRKDVNLPNHIRTLGKVGAEIEHATAAGGIRDAYTVQNGFLLERQSAVHMRGRRCIGGRRYARNQRYKATHIAWPTRNDQGEVGQC